jgi:hypothetical protein
MKKYLNIFNSNHLVFLTVHACLISGDANFTVHSLVQKESEYVGTFSLFLTGY